MYQTSFLLLCFGLFCCKQTETVAPVLNSVQTDTFFVKGADVSWLTEMEANGIVFYNKLGKQTDCFQILSSLGVNTIRLRVWVNPKFGWNNIDDVVKKAIRAKNAGMRLLINFHYSDSWADPGQQTKPIQWDSLSFLNLTKAVYEHTYSVLHTLHQNNIFPHWVQIGNETNNGMLWPQGKASENMSNFAQLINAGYEATKKVFPSCKVLVHLSNGYDQQLYKWMLSGLKTHQAKFDVVGMSLYPSATDWQQKNADCLANMQYVINEFDKPIMIVEVGMSWDEANACKLFMKDIIQKLKTLQHHNGLGVLYWEPQAYKQWKQYTLGAFDNSGKPTVALDAFLEK